MRIQNAFVYKPITPAFKAKGYYEDGDYGTYYNQISIKDAAISATILSGMLLGVGALIQNSGNILKFLQTTKSQIKKFFPFSKNNNKFNKLG